MLVVFLLLLSLSFLLFYYFFGTTKRKMISRKAVHNVVGIVGNVISCGLFLSPAPTFYRIAKKKDVEEFQYYPYVVTVMNCMFWVFYGLPVVKQDSLLVVTINGLGLVIELIYLSIFCRYDKQGRSRNRVLMSLGAETIVMGILVCATLLCFHTHSTRSLFMGVFCDVLNILMYASPLLIMKKVIKTKSVEFMPFFLSLANFLNGVCWTAYGLIIFDLFILISNGLGAIFGLMQLILYACYFNSTPKHKDGDEGDAVKPTEIQLSSGARV